MDFDPQFHNLHEVNNCSKSHKEKAKFIVLRMGSGLYKIEAYQDDEFFTR